MWRDIQALLPEQTSKSLENKAFSFDLHLSPSSSLQCEHDDRQCSTYLKTRECRKVYIKDGGKGRQKKHCSLKTSLSSFARSCNIKILYQEEI